MSHFPSTPFLHFILKSERLIFGGPKKEHLNPIKIHSIFIFQLNNQKPYLSLSPPHPKFILFIFYPLLNHPNQMDTYNVFGWRSEKVGG